MLAEKRLMKASDARKLQWVLVFTHAMWFFGNLYEEIVDTPNLLAHAVEARAMWRQYHALTNPVYYHVPNTLVALAVLALVHACGRQHFTSEGARFFKRATAFSLLGVGLTVAIVTTLNFSLFLGTQLLPAPSIQWLVLTWLIGNGLRLGFVGTALFYFLKSILLTSLPLRTND